MTSPHEDITQERERLLRDVEVLNSCRITGFLTARSRGYEKRDALISTSYIDLYLSHKLQVTFPIFHF
jgi:hypothetical protein